MKKFRFSCLSGPHLIKDCKAERTCGVNGCTKKHRRPLHYDSSKPKQQSASCDSPRRREPVNQDNATSISSSSLIDKSTVPANGDEPSRNRFLQIVKVSVSNRKQIQTTLALLDSGSNISYMDAKYKSDLKLKGHKASLNVF